MTANILASSRLLTTDPQIPVSNICIVNCEVSLLNDLLCHSNYIKLLRVFSYVLRFINNVKSHSRRGALDALELAEAEKKLIRMIQGEVLSAEVRGLQRQNCIPTGSKLKGLNPFLDSDGVLRVGGRLDNSDLPYTSKHPAILPKHKLTNLVVSYIHAKNLHVGATSLLYLVRENFWPLNGRSLCRKVVHECVVCFRAQPKATSQLMGSLPRDRVIPNLPFNCSGVDFCGPFMVRYKNQRKGILHKIYICIFVCFATRAVHVEMVSDLTSEAFIATLKRFFGRRGRCAKLYSDNGTNFVGANQEIKRLMKLVKDPDDDLSAFLAAEGIDWRFIPPRAPSFGGLWEAAVKSLKYHLYRAVRGSNLTYEEFLTVCVQVEGILNSRPLCPMSNNADDFEALTPAHFLIGRTMTSIVEPNLTELKENALKRWQKVTRLVQLVWKKWHRSYLSSLQQRNKWQVKKDNVRVGDLAVLIEDNLPTFKWPLGRIIELYKGGDNLVRVVKIKTQKGVYKRAISRVCLLPVPE